MDNIEDSGVTGGALLPTLLLGKSGDSDVGAGRGAPQSRAGRPG